MEPNTRRAAQAIAAALAFTVVTQIAYLALDAGGKSEIGYPIWRLEAVLQLVVIAFGLMLVPRQPLLGGAISASGIFNLLQLGLGLTMFYNLGLGTEDGPEPTFFAVVGFAFFLYFAAKALLGIAAFALGAALWREERGPWRIVGALTALSGLAALAVNIAAMASEMELTFPAGAAGTVATALLALALSAASRQGNAQLARR
ncbi:hypothetical protein [Aurantiacibacter gilvus]|uniref:Thiamine biosynthesis protein ThiC n=1 Tax=Aurantiacibacter gilvus TaxID=3139141 RepID=A0ABU9IGC0_9SPHN